MASQSSFSFLAIALLLAISAHAVDQLDAELVSVQFGYSGSFGPANWGALSQSFAACSSGKMQSPVNINKNETVLNKNLTVLTRDYKPANATLVNNGFNIALRYESEGGTLIIDGKNYTLKQMHWHSPSEHLIDGVQYAAELHLVHFSDSGSASVVAILFQHGDADPFVTKIHSNLDELAKEVCAGDEDAHIPVGILDNKLLRKNTRKYYRYIGSLTTPPCTENVTWNILGKVRSISREQVEALKAPLSNAYKINSRPVQSLNGRNIELYNEFSD